jgi:type IV pilus assembly protein PilV
MKQQSRGFSLLEVIIAATIFAVGMLALAGLQYTSVYSIGAGDRRVAATNLVEQVLEAARNQGISNFNAGDYTGEFDVLGNAYGDDGTGLKLVRVVTVSGNSVNVDVSWSVKGEIKHVKASTFLY